MHSLRFFIAIEVPEENKPELELVQQNVGRLLPNIRLTKSEKLHITLAFVGEQSETLIQPLIELLKTAADQIEPFQLIPSYIDGFPRIHEFNTLWVGVKGDIDRLLILRERIKDGLVALNLPVDERRFTPHIAIGKAHGQYIDTVLENQLQGIVNKPFQPIMVRSIKLFESIPTGDDHQHSLLAQIDL